MSSNTYENTQLIERLQRKTGKLAFENERLRAALQDIVEVGDGFGGQGTTGEGHARCREIARRALERK